MLFSFLVTLREGLEAALIVAIILGSLARTGRRGKTWPLWVGVAAAAAATLSAAVGLQLLAVELPGRVQEAVEGVAMLLAVGVLTWMVFWMRAQARQLGVALRERVDGALSAGSAFALALLAFTAVGREGLETALFLFAGHTRAESEFAYWGGALAGLVVATAAGFTVYSGSRRLPLRAFFTTTSLLLVLLTAGLLANGMKELHEARLLFPHLGPRLWDTYEVLPDNAGFGRFLAALVGYDASPFLGQAAAYAVYVTLVPTLYLWSGRTGAPGSPPRAEVRA